MKLAFLFLVHAFQHYMGLYVDVQEQIVMVIHSFWYALLRNELALVEGWWIMP